MGMWVVYDPALEMFLHGNNITAISSNTQFYIKATLYLIFCLPYLILYNIAIKGIDIDNTDAFLR